MARLTSIGHPINLAIIAGQLGLGGAEQQLYYLLSGLDRVRFRPVVINLGVIEAECWEERIKGLDVPVHRVSRAFGRPVRLLKIANILWSCEAAIVHAWAFHTNLYAAVAGRLAGVPVRLGSMRESYAGLPGNGFRRTGLAGLDGLITNSQANVEPLQQLPHLKTHVVPNGIDVASTAALDRGSLKTELGLAFTDTVIGTIGRMDTNKNHSMLIRAFATLAAKWPTLHLVIIGDGPSRGQIAADVSRAGLAARVHLPGAIPSAARYLPAFDVCCLTSYTEGMPNVLMEASAAGVPAVATTSGSSAEVIESGVTGFLVPAHDDDQFVARIDALLMQPELARHMGLAGRDKMRREYSIETMSRRMMNLYQAALAEKV